MVEAEITRSDARTKSRENILKVACTIVHQSGSISKLAFCAALVAFISGSLFWLVSFSPYFFDSLKSVLVCSLALGVMCAPGILFFKVHGSLKRISTLLARVDEVQKLDPEARKASLEPLVVPTRDVWHQKLWARLLSCVEIRSLLLFWKDDLVQLAGVARAIGMLVHPATAIGVVIAAVSTIFLLLGSLLVVLWSMCRAVF